jgi:hypothetical protein
MSKNIYYKFNVIYNNYTVQYYYFKNIMLFISRL